VLTGHLRQQRVLADRNGTALRDERRSGVPAKARRLRALQEKARCPFLSAVPMFVPSLSWQNDRFYTCIYIYE